MCCTSECAWLFWIYIQKGFRTIKITENFEQSSKNLEHSLKKMLNKAWKIFEFSHKQNLNKAGKNLEFSLKKVEGLKNLEHHYYLKNLEHDWKNLEDSLKNIWNKFENPWTFFEENVEQSLKKLNFP